MKSFPVVLACLLLAVATYAQGSDDPPPEVKRFIAEGETNRQYWLGQVASFRSKVDAAIALMRRARFNRRQSEFCILKDGRYTFRRREDRDAVAGEYEGLRDALLSYERNLAEAEGKAAPKLEIRDGSVGIAYDAFRVIQVVDAENMIAEIHGQVLWLEGLPTEGVVDGERLTIRKSLIVDGVKRYESTMGSVSTVRRLRPLNAESWIGGQATKVDLQDTLVSLQRGRRRIPLPE